MSGDLRYAFRQLLRRPAFAALAVGTLALGIGASATMFAVVNATVLRPLPYPDADRLVFVRETSPEGHNFTASQPNYLDFRDGTTALAGLGAYQDASLTVTGGGESQRFDALMVTHDFFTVLGVVPALGRAFVAAESAPGAESATVVLGHALWLQRFGGDPSVVGGDIVLEGRARTVIGVMPPGFAFAGESLWIPLAPDPSADRGNHWLGMVGRLAVGVDAGRAAAELAAVAARIGERHPEIAGWGVRVQPLKDLVVGEDFRMTAFLLFGAVGLLLVMACANLASLFSVRATTRDAEFGVRAALGARRPRLARQLLVEAVVISVLGAAAGIALTYGALGVMQALGPDAIPRVDEIRLDAAVLAFSVAAAVATGIAFGLLPSLRASRVDINQVLKQGGRGMLAREGRRGRDALVVVQVALAVVLLAGAGLLMRSLLELQRSDPGYDPRAVFATELQLGDRYSDPPWQRVVFFDELSQRLEGLPGIRAVGATAVEPFSGFSFGSDVTPVERAAEVGPSGLLLASWRAVTPGFFDAMGIPLLRGRLFTAQDPFDGPRIVVVSAAFAAAMWPEEEAVGKRFYWGGTTGTPRTVVGVVGDYHDVEVGGDAPPVMFLPYNQLPWPKMTVVVSADGGIDAVAAAVRNEVRALDPGIVVPPVRPLTQMLAGATAGPRLRTQVLTGFSIAALALASIGLYGVVTLNISHRRREIGLRVALGASPRVVAARFALGGIRLATIGIAIGLFGVWALAQALAAILYRTAPLDPVALGGAAVTLALVAAAASVGPARQAVRIDPMEALRDE